MKRVSLFLFCLLFNVCNVLIAKTLAFPGAEGFGRYASGGRGGHVITVTSLEDYTSAEEPIEGTLRWALNQYVHQEEIDGKTITVYEPLTIVFNVAGNLFLKEDLKVKRDNLTIAGQTAPGDGICIVGHSMEFNGATGGEMWYWGPRRKNIIVRYMRFRPTIPDETYVTYGTDVENYENVIFDHCTMTWANEEVLAIYDTKYTTVQWCIAAEGLYKANHKKGTRSYCGVWGGQFASYHHNLIAHNDSRNIRFDGARAHDTVAVVDFHNNVVYNWGSNNSGYGLEVEIKVPDVTRNELNMINNYYKHGPATGYKAGTAAKYNDKINRFVRIDQDTASWLAGYQSKHYIEGNYMTNYDDITADNWWCGVQFNTGSVNDTARLKSYFRAATPSPEVAEVIEGTVQTAEDAFLSVLDGVGACAPRRDWQDARIVNETRTGTAIGQGSKKKDGIIDDPQVVGGWPLLQGDPYIDTDGDGIPDAWELENGLNPADAADGAVITESGYSNLELYINSIEPDFTRMPQVEDETLRREETAVDNIQSVRQNSRLVMINGVVMVEKDGELYTIQGQQIR